MAFITWLSGVGLVLLIALAPITLRAAFDGELLVRLRIYGIPYTIAPRKKRNRAKAAGRKSGKISKKAIKADKKRRKNDPLSISQMLKEDGVGAVLAYLKGMASLMNTLVRRILKKDETLGLPDEQEKGVFEIMPTSLPDWKKMAEVIYTAGPHRILVTDEIGYGIVPVDPFEREYREETGRICCLLAERSEEVWRVCCGLGTRLK